VSADGSHSVTRVVAEFDRRGAVPLGEGDFCRAYLLDEDIVLRIARHDRADAALRLEESLLPVIAAHVTLAVPLRWPRVRTPSQAPGAYVGLELLRSAPRSPSGSLSTAAVKPQAEAFGTGAQPP
jgi:hypothetical protein